MEFGNYDVIERIAVGSTAVVYKARHRELGQYAAIKELTAQLRATPRALERFRAEAQILAGFDHPNVVTVYDFVEEPDRSWIAEEWIDGLTIESLLARAGTLTAEQCLGVLRGALLGLGYAHARGVVHGDLAPGNIIADRAGTSKLVDFGVSAPVGSAEVYGTPAFMSPEAARGAPVGPAGDLYSAGAMLYLLLAGRPVFPAGTVGEVLAGHINKTPPELTGHGRGLAALVADALAKDPHTRPPDAAEFLRRLEDGAQERYGAGWLERSSIAGPVVAVLGGAAGAGAGMGMLGGGPSAAPVASAAPAFAESAINTGSPKVVGRNFWRSPRTLGFGGAAAVVAVAVVIVSVAGGSDGPKGSLAADPTPGSSSGAAVPGPISSAPPSSAPPSVAPVDSLPASGKYKIETTVLSTNYESESVGGHFKATWQFDLSCAATACRGTVGSGSGPGFKVEFDGTTLTGMLRTPDVAPCVYTSGPKKGQPNKSTRFRRVETTTFRLTVTKRSDGPTPVAGTVLTMSGFATNRTPRGEVIKGTCENHDHDRHDRQRVTVTWVSD